MECSKLLPGRHSSGGLILGDEPFHVELGVRKVGVFFHEVGVLWGAPPAPEGGFVLGDQSKAGVEALTGVPRTLLRSPQIDERGIPGGTDRKEVQELLIEELLQLGKDGLSRRCRGPLPQEYVGDANHFFDNLRDCLLALLLLLLSPFLSLSLPPPSLSLSLWCRPLPSFSVFCFSFHLQ